MLASDRGNLDSQLQIWEKRTASKLEYLATVFPQSCSFAEYLKCEKRWTTGLQNRDNNFSHALKFHIPEIKHIVRVTEHIFRVTEL